MSDVDRLVRGHLGVAQYRFQQVRVHADDCEKIVQLVGAPTGDVGEGLELLGFQGQCLFDRTASGKIFDLEQDRRVRRIHRGNEPSAQPEYSMTPRFLVVNQLEMI